jgi:hypothetical protein
MWESVRCRCGGTELLGSDRSCHVAGVLPYHLKKIGRSWD